MSVSFRPAKAQDSEFAYRVKKATLGEFVRQVWGWDEGEQRRLHRRRFASQGRIRDSHLLRNGVKARHGKMVEVTRRVMSDEREKTSAGRDGIAGPVETMMTADG